MILIVLIVSITLIGGTFFFNPQLHEAGFVSGGVNPTQNQNSNPPNEVLSFNTNVFSDSVTSSVVKISTQQLRDIGTVNVVPNSEGLGVVQDGRLVLNVSHRVLLSGIEYDLSATKLNFPTITSDATITSRSNDFKYGYNFRGVPQLLRDEADTIIVFTGENVRIQDEEFTKKVYFGDSLHLDFWHEINQTGLQVTTRNSNSFLIRGVQSYDPTLQFNGCLTIGTGNSSTEYELTEDISCAGNAISFDGDNNTLNLMGFNVIYANSTSGTGITIEQTSTLNTVKNGTVRTLSNATPTGAGITASGANMTIMNLTITIFNNTAAGRGIVMIGGTTDGSRIIGNSINTRGSGNSEGIFAQSSSYGIISYNNINASNKGITIQRTSLNNLITMNKLNGTAGSSVIELITVSNLNPLFNNITYNLIRNTGTATTAILLDTDVNYTMIEYNNVSHSGTSGNNAALQITTRSRNNIARHNNFSQTNQNSLRLVMVRLNSTNNSVYDNKLIMIGSLNGARAFINDTVVEEGNFYNTSYQAGTNIVGGGFLGGNYYTNQTDTAFSGTCTDADTDGICDSPYVFFVGTDYLPLSNKFVPAGAAPQMIGNATIVFPTDGQKFNVTNSTINYTQNGTTPMTYTWYIYYNGTFDHTATTNTTFNFSDGTYALNVSAFNGSVWSRNYSITFSVENTTQPFVSPDNIGNVTIFSPTENQIILTRNFSVTYGSNGTPVFSNTWFIYLNGSFNHSANTNTTLNLSDGSYALNVSVYNGSVWSPNSSRLFSVSVPSPGNVNGTLLLTAISSSAFLIEQNQTFQLIVNVTCVGGNCHQVDSTSWYNLSGTITTPVNYTLGDKPFYNTSGSINQTCGFLSENQACQYNLVLNATGRINSSWALTVNFTTNNSYVLPNGTSPITLRILGVIIPCVKLWSCSDWVVNDSNMGYEYRFCSEVDACWNVSNMPVITRVAFKGSEGSLVFIPLLAGLLLTIFSYTLKSPRHFPLRVFMNLLALLTVASSLHFGVSALENTGSHTGLVDAVGDFTLIFFLAWSLILIYWLLYTVWAGVNGLKEGKEREEEMKY